MRAALALAVLIVATSAAAQTPPETPRAPPPRPVAAPSPAPKASQSPFTPQARQQDLSGALGGGLATPSPPLVGFRGLQGLSAVGDTAPQCRTTCTKARAACGDEQECSDRWGQCVRRCTAPKS